MGILGCLSAIITKWPQDSLTAKPGACCSKKLPGHLVHLVMSVEPPASVVIKDAPSSTPAASAGAGAPSAQPSGAERPKTVTLSSVASTANQILFKVGKLHSSIKAWHKCVVAGQNLVCS